MCAFNKSSFLIIYRESPFKRAPHISKVQASNTIEPVCNILSFLLNFIKLVFLTSLTMLLFSINTPLGVPVEPDVYIIYAGASASKLRSILDVLLNL